MTKSDYVSSALYGRHPFKQLAEAAILFWHCDIKLLPAKMYLDRLETKLKQKRYDKN